MKLKFIAILLASTAAAAAAFAHGKATGIVKERMDQMVGLADAMKVLKAEIAHSGAYDANAVTEAARNIKLHSGEALTSKFPEGSLSEASEALPSVWNDWDRFSELALQLEAYAEALETAAADGVPNDHGAMMDGGMMSGGGTMMGGMMQHAATDPDHLAQMPPMASFQAIADTCSACHTDFRKKKAH